jgi:hypothetical protein
LQEDSKDIDMTRELLIAPLLALGLAASPAIASPDQPQAEAPAEARIPFVNHGGIRDWRAEDNDTLYVQDRHRQWYKATLMHNAIGLRFANAIGFETRGIDSFDRFSSIVVDGQRIPIQSLVRVEAPPSRQKRDEAGKA